MPLPWSRSAAGWSASPSRLGVPVTVSQHYPKGLGPSVEALRSALTEDAAVLDKMHFSCMGDDALRHRFDALRDYGRGQVIIAGIEAHVCVGQTALDLIADGFEVYIAADGVSSRSSRSRDLSLKRIRQAGGLCGRQRNGHVRMAGKGWHGRV